MSIQILQYEFLGPIKLEEWGPPMEKVVYLILSRTQDSFSILYVGDCEKTVEKNFFEKNLDFNCWIQKARSKNSLYLAILPMFESNQSKRKGIVEKILLRFKPPCNAKNTKKQPPDYIVRSKSDLPPTSKSLNDIQGFEEKILCPCCGSKMEKTKILEKTTVLKCTGCGLSDTRLNS